MPFTILRNLLSLMTGLWPILHNSQKSLMIGLLAKNFYLGWLNVDWTGSLPIERHFEDHHALYQKNVTHMTFPILLQFLLRLGKTGFYLILIQLKICCMMTCATRRKFPSNLQHQQKIMKLVILGFCCNVIFWCYKTILNFTLELLHTQIHLHDNQACTWCWFWVTTHGANITWVTTSTLTSTSKYKQVQASTTSCQHGWPQTH